MSHKYDGYAHFYCMLYIFCKKCVINHMTFFALLSACFRLSAHSVYYHNLSIEVIVLRKYKRKILGGILCAGGALLLCGGYSLLTRHIEDSIPASLSGAEERPMIVLDAGHGG